MDSTLIDFLVGVSSGMVSNAGTEGLKSAYQKLFATRPELSEKLTKPASVASMNLALGEIAGELEALANTGQISIDRAVVQALRTATFNHQDGQVQIGNSQIKAPILNTGGTGKGQTVIGSNTVLSSAGTSIQVGQGASIVISGNAGVRQN